MAGSWSSTTTFEFSKVYNRPIVGTFEDGRDLFACGYYCATYSGSHTTPSSYIRYYGSLCRVINFAHF